MPLDRELSDLFFFTVGEPAFELYSNPQSRELNDGKLGELVKGVGPLAEMGMELSLEVISTYEMLAIPSLEKFLADYKK